MKRKALKLSDYFEIKKPSYTYIKIIPHKSVRNFNSSNIAKMVAGTYRSLNKMIKKEKKKLIVESFFKISYVIDINSKDVSFYFIVPQFYQVTLLEKIKEIWSKTTVEIVEEGIKPFSTNSLQYELSYKKDDALSLNVDKKSNEPLNQILSVMQVMKDEDRITLIYNFMPASQMGWIDKYNSAMEKIKRKECVEKNVMSFEYILKQTSKITLGIIDTLFSVINDFLGGKELNNKESLYSSIMGVLEQQKDLSIATKKKRDLQVINTQIIAVSESADDSRKVNNIDAVTGAFRAIDEDNELRANLMKRKINTIEQYSLGTKVSKFSVDECQNFIQIPGRMLLTTLGIKHIKTEEAIVPERLRNGIKRLGASTYKGAVTNAYLEDSYNVGNLPLVLIGAQGGGKTTYLCNYAKDCINTNEGLVVIDFIKNCELSEDIKKVVPKEKLVEVDLANEESIQGLGYNEIKINEKMTAFEKLKYANIQTQQVMELIDSISIGDPLSSRMRRFIQAAGDIVFSLGYNSIKDVINCLEKHNYRLKYLNKLSPDLKELLEDEIATLEELNEYSKVSAKEAKEGAVSEIIGTASSKIEHILDRVSMLRSDFKLKYMYNKDLRDNIDLVECMEEGKVVLFKMRQDEFPGRMIKNILVTYLVSKIWSSCEIRGKSNSKPLRCNTIIDEVFQAPTVMSRLEYIIPQSRKFGCKFVFSTQYIRQLESIFDVLEASGSSYMLLTGALEDDFNHFKSKLVNFEYEDLKDMSQYSSMNLIYYSEGYGSFITKLPKPI